MGRAGPRTPRVRQSRARGSKSWPRGGAITDLGGAVRPLAAVGWRLRRRCGLEDTAAQAQSWAEGAAGEVWRGFEGMNR